MPRTKSIDPNQIDILGDIEHKLFQIAIHSRQALQAIIDDDTIRAAQTIAVIEVQAKELPDAIKTYAEADNRQEMHQRLMMRLGF